MATGLGHAPFTGTRLALRPRCCNMVAVKRLRALVAILGCLAVLAGSLASVAAMAPPNQPATESNTANAPCSHCDDCDSAPCPMPTAACLQASPNMPSTLAVAAFNLPSTGFSKIHWPLRATALRGRSPPPDPFPPRV
jgi:hypothetical protein